MTKSAIEYKGRPRALAPGARLQNRYRVVRLLGKGGMGAVYEAVDERLDVTVALKETFSSHDRLRRQFEQEARLLAQLDHPALPRVTDYFAEGDGAFLVMQFIAGQDLAEIISNQPGPFPQHQAIAWADQLLGALIYLHNRDRQIVHRDIKPHNLKVTASGQIALLDFGLAKSQPMDASTTVSSESVFGYTRRYSPLEQIQDQGTTPRSDIYALGATLYHLLTGAKPPDALARAAALVKEKRDSLGPASEINPAVGAELSAILLRAMALNPDDRYASAEEFREALRKLGRNDSHGQRAQTNTASLGSAVVSTTVAKPRVVTIDPFDSYAILKPDEVSFLIPKSKRNPALALAILCVVLVGGVAAFYNVDRVSEAAASLTDFAGKDESSNSSNEISQSKPQTSPVPTRPAMAASPANEYDRRTNLQRAKDRRDGKSDSSQEEHSRTANR